MDLTFLYVIDVIILYIFFEPEGGYPKPEPVPPMTPEQIWLTIGIVFGLTAIVVFLFTLPLMIDYIKEKIRTRNFRKHLREFLDNGGAEIWYESLVASGEIKETWRQKRERARKAKEKKNAINNQKK